MTALDPLYCTSTEWVTFLSCNKKINDCYSSSLALFSSSYTSSCPGPWLAVGLYFLCGGVRGTSEADSQTASGHWPLVLSAGRHTLNPSWNICSDTHTHTTHTAFMVCWSQVLWQLSLSSSKHRHTQRKTHTGAALMFSGLCDPMKWGTANEGTLQDTTSLYVGEGKRGRPQWLWNRSYTHKHTPGHLMHETRTHARTEANRNINKFVNIHSGQDAKTPNTFSCQVFGTIQLSCLHWWQQTRGDTSRIFWLCVQQQ